MCKLLTAVCILVLLVGGNHGQRRRQRNNARRNNNNGLPSILANAYNDAVVTEPEVPEPNHEPSARSGNYGHSSGYDSDTVPNHEPSARSSGIERHAPTLPPADQIDCYVDVEMVRQVGGRCVRLGGVGQRMVCQSGMYLDVNSDECQQLTRQREMAYHVQNLNTDSDMGGPH